MKPALPDFCPYCNAFWHFDWTTGCGNCGATLVNEQASNTAQGMHPAPAGASKPRVGIGSIFAIIGVVVLLLVGGAAVTLSMSPSTAKQQDDESLALVDSPTTVNSAQAANDKVKSLVLPSSAFNPKWALLSPGITVASASDLQGSTCFPGDAHMNVEAGVSGLYGYNVQPDESEGDSLIYAAETAFNQSDQDHQFNNFQTKTEQQCLVANAKSFWSSFGVVSSQKLVQVPRTLPVAYIDYRISDTVVSVHGTNHATDEIVFLKQGDTRVRLQFDYCGCKLGPAPDQDAIINQAASTLQKSS